MMIALWAIAGLVGCMGWYVTHAEREEARDLAAKLARRLAAHPDEKDWLRLHLELWDVSVTADRLGTGRAGRVWLLRRLAAGEQVGELNERAADKEVDSAARTPRQEPNA